jgi:hypothetical protein
MTALAQGLERTSPELLDIAAMGLDVITYEQRGIAFDPAALGALAGVEIAQEDLQTQSSPARGLVQRSTWVIAIAAAVSLTLSLRRASYRQRRPNRAKP